MGILCPCGVSVNALSNKKYIKLRGKCGTICGNLTYLADVCVTRLGRSTLSLRFVDPKYPNVNNFLFTANNIASVDCRKEGKNCVVTVRGTGSVNGKIYPFTAVFKDQVSYEANDIIQYFVIEGFFDQNGAALVPQGAITALGCQDM